MRFRTVAFLLAIAVPVGACGSDAGPERPTIDPSWTVPSTTQPPSTMQPPSTTQPPATTQPSGGSGDPESTTTEVTVPTTTEVTVPTTVSEAFCPDLAGHLEREGSRLADLRSGLGPDDPQVYVEAASAMSLLAGWLLERAPVGVVGSAERLATLWREATMPHMNQSEGEFDARAAMAAINAALVGRHEAMAEAAEAVTVFLLDECPYEVALMLAGLDPRSAVRPSTTPPPSTLPKEIRDFIRKLLTGS